MLSQGDLAGNVETKSGLHGALDVVLMCVRMAEDGEQPVALGVAEMAAIMPDDAYHLVAVASNQVRYVRARFGSTVQLNERGPRKGLLSFGFRPDRPGRQADLGIDGLTVDGQDLLGERLAVARCPSASACSARSSSSSTPGGWWGRLTG